MNRRQIQASARGMQHHPVRSTRRFPRHRHGCIIATTRGHHRLLQLFGFDRLAIDDDFQPLGRQPARTLNRHLQRHGTGGRLDLIARLLSTEGVSVVDTPLGEMLRVSPAAITLLTRKNRVQTRETLLNDVWGIHLNVETRTVDTHIKRLREKIGAAGVYIHTVRGVGYRFADNPEDTE